MISIDARNAYDAIAALDLDRIKMKLMHSSGESWSQEKADAVEVEYRRFLFLSKLYPEEQVTPLVEVDIFWHYHILDTMKYAQDCEQAFGFFVHHQQYMGMEGTAEDTAEHGECIDRMRELYEATFGEAYGSNPVAYGADEMSAATQAGTEAAFCTRTPVTAQAAFCTRSPATAQAAFCTRTPASAQAAFCTRSPASAKAAFCTRSAATAQAAFCTRTPVPAQAAFCTRTPVTAKAAFCTRTPASAQAAFCTRTPVTAKAAFCTRTPASAQAAFCTRTPVTAQAAFCTRTPATAQAAFCTRTPATPQAAFCTRAPAQSTATVGAERAIKGNEGPAAPRLAKRQVAAIGLAA